MLFFSTELSQLANSDTAVAVRWAITFGAFIVAIYFAKVLNRYIQRSRTVVILEGEVKALSDKCDRLEGENKQLVADSHAKDVELAEFKAKTDLTDLIRQNQMFQKELVNRLDQQGALLERVITLLDGVEKRLRTHQ